jgi:hypothetical protein
VAKASVRLDHENERIHTQHVVNDVSKHPLVVSRRDVDVDYYVITLLLRNVCELTMKEFLHSMLLMMCQNHPLVASLCWSGLFCHNSISPKRLWTNNERIYTQYVNGVSKTSFGGVTMRCWRGLLCHNSISPKRLWTNNERIHTQHVFHGVSKPSVGEVTMLTWIIMS